MTVQTKVILGTAIASLLAMGQADAIVNPFAKKPAPTTQAGDFLAGYEGLKGTYMYQTTKDIVKIIDTAKSPSEAQDKICGKGMMGLKPGYMREGGGNRCDRSAHTAILVINMCGGYKDFDGSDCARKAKTLLWPTKSKSVKNLSGPGGLMSFTIEIPLTTEEVIGDTPDKFASQIDSTKERHDLTPYDDMLYYAMPEFNTKHPGYQLSNAKVILCSYDKQKKEFFPRKNLFGKLNDMASMACLSTKAPEQQAKSEQKMLTLVGKVGLSPSKGVSQEASLAPMVSKPQNLGKIQIEEEILPPSKIQTQGALKDLDTGRANMLDADRSYSSTVGKIPEGNVPQIKGAQSSTTATGQPSEAQKKLLEAGKDVATAQKGLIKSLSPSKAPAIPANATKTCANISAATPKEIRENVVPVFVNQPSTLSLDDKQKTNISRALELSSAPGASPKYIKEAGQGICAAMTRSMN